MLTMLRIVLIPLVLYFLALGTPRFNFWAMVVYIVSAVTDFLDGYLARKLGVISVLGKFLDPLADKLLVMGTLVFMVYLDRLPLWGAVAVIVILGRELTVTALRTIAMSEGVVIAARQGGKEKTALQMVAILLLIMQHRYTIDFFFFSVSADLTQVGVVVLYLSLVFAITSGGEYFALFVDAVEAKEKRLLADESEDADEASPEEPREL
ncbi:MAG: CDP-diacylglycerol--glycerol-3-phosphate 3-phosphatidyltransferase [Deltaproteobacteria bacterium]|nr:CDP-diacylglycerol--glycerol-3-phosphate 3-phosphatidyltransferase [Deltaproteobacteria bacterium]